MLNLDYSLVILLISLFVFAYLLKKIILSPVQQIIENREITQIQMERKINELRSENENLEKQLEQEKSQIRAKAMALQNSIIEEAKRESELLINKARAESERELKEKKQLIIESYQKTKQELDVKINEIANYLIDTIQKELFKPASTSENKRKI